MAVLIISFPDDGHALMVKWALEQRGAEVDFVYAGDFPQRATATFDLDRQAFMFDGPSAWRETYRVIWDRRGAGVLMPDDLHPLDKRYARAISQGFLEAHKIFHRDRAFWINDWKAVPTIESKPQQLVMARAVGLKTPPTLISNDPQRIRDFVGRRPCVTKTLGRVGWEADGRTIGLRTTEISLDDLTDDAAIRVCPMIYQAKVEKRLEYRIVVMGHEVLCLEIDSQGHAETRLDLRADFSRLGVREVEAPAGLAKRLLAFMQMAGVVFASFDLALDTQGDLVFFEANPQGQFLWLEELCPDCRVLDRMAAFIEHGASDFSYRPVGEPRTMAGYYAGEATRQACADLRARHMPSPAPNLTE